MTKSVTSSASKSVSTEAPNGVGGGLMEAVWLAAVVVVPLIFDQHAFANFAPYKAAMMRLLAAIVVACWGISVLLTRSLAGIGREVPKAVWMALAGLLGAQILATLFSVNPRASVWGGAETAEGLWSSVAEVVLFVAVAGNLRRWAQIERLVTAIVTTSIPVALYAIIQRGGFDPVAFVGFSERVFSTLGHPIYLAAYLLMVMPLTWWKIARARPAVAGPPSLGRRLFWCGVALLQMVGFLCAQSRGPLLGLMAAATFLGLAWAVRTKRWRGLLRGGVAFGLVAAFFLFLNLPIPASLPVARALRMAHLADTLGLRKGGDPFRKAHWEAAVRLMNSPEAIAFPSGGGDRWHFLRPWIGYGPETLENVLPQRFIWTTTEAKPENRLHNRVLDLWFATGALGVLAFYGFFLVIFRQGLESGGWNGRKVAFVVAPSLAVAGGVLFGVGGGAGFIGLGLIVGMVMGCGVGVLAFARTTPERPRETAEIADREMLTFALLAALLGHLLETGFAFTVTATALLFWLYAALVLALAHVQETASGKSRGDRARSRTAREGAGWLTAYAPTLILVTLLFAFVELYSLDSIDGTTVLARTLTRIKGDQGPSHLLWFLFLPTWLAASFACAGDDEKSAAARWWAPLTISAGIAGAYALLKGMQIAGIGALPALSDPPAVALASIAGYHGLYFTFMGLVLGLVLAAAVLLESPEGKMVKGAFRLVRLNLLAISLGLAAAWFLALRDIRADITASWGQALLTFGRLEASTEVLGQSVREAPESLVHRRELGAAFVQRAQASRNFGSFDWLAHEAESSLLPAAAQAHGLTLASADLARLYLAWAAFTPEADQRLLRARQAATYFAWQQRFLPGHALSWLDSAVLDEFLQQPAEAMRKLRIAEGLMKGTAGYWAKSYGEQAAACSAPELRQAYAEVDFRLFEIALEEAQPPASAAILRLQRATLELGMGRIKEAREDCEASEPLLPAVEIWLLHATLAEIDRQTGQLASAKDHLAKAIARAPADKKATLLEQQHRLEGPRAGSGIQR